MKINKRQLVLDIADMEKVNIEVNNTQIKEVLRCTLNLLGRKTAVRHDGAESVLRLVREAWDGYDECES